MSCQAAPSDRKSTRLNSSHLGISYAVFCLKKKEPLTPSGGLHRATLSAGSVASLGLVGACACGGASIDSGRACVGSLWPTFYFFFLKDRGPPEFSPFPLHAALPI